MQDSPDHSFGSCYIEKQMLGWSQSVALAPAASMAQELEPAQSITHHESPLLLSCLEAAMAKLGGSINEFEFNGFLRPAACMHQKGLEKRSYNASGLSLQQIWTSALMEAGLKYPRCIH